MLYLPHRVREAFTPGISWSQNGEGLELALSWILRIGRLLRLGFVINAEKSALLLTQKKNLSGIVSGLAPLGGVSGRVQETPCAFPSSQICALQIMSSVAWTDGVCRPCSPSIVTCWHAN